MTIDAIRTFIQIEILNDPGQGIEPEQDLLLTGTLDSLSVVRLIDHLEQKTGVKIPPADITLENFGSLRRITDYLDGRAD